MLYTILKTSHSWWALLTILILLVAIINAITGWKKGRTFTARDRKLSLIAMTFAHLQLLAGLALYFTSPIGLAVLGQISSPILRLTSLEHPLMGILAITLITIGWSKHKKSDDNTQKFKHIAIFFGAGLLLILSRIPWSLWI